MSGWVAQTGVQDDAGINAFTLGSTAVTGAERDGNIELAAFELAVEGGSLPPTDSLALTRVVLDLTSTELVAGSVQGTWHQMEFDTACDVPFSATLSIEPDVAAPNFVAAASVLPFEAIFVRLSEPTQAASAIFGASANNLPVASDVTFRLDPGRDGFVTHAWIAPHGLWPAGGRLDVGTDGLLDAIGNPSAPATVALDVPPAPASNANAGFEAGGNDWIAGDPALQFSNVGHYYDDNDVLQSFAPSEGTTMVLFEAEANALAGYLVAPPGATQLLFDGGFTDTTSVADLQQQAAGLVITLADEQGAREAFNGAQLPAPMATRFTGLSTVALDLPANAASGFWIAFGCRGFAPPVFGPTCVVDNLRFQ